MREAFVILAVIVVLLALTAIRYRKQIAGLISLAKTLREVKKSAAARSFPGEGTASVPLVNCSTCEIWVPRNKARKVGEVYYCSEVCGSVRKPARK